MSNDRIQVLQQTMKAIPVADYLIISLALALGASHIIGESGATLSALTKIGAASVIISLWWVMVYSFMQSAFSISKSLLVAVATFIALSNLVLAYTLDKPNLGMTGDIAFVLLMVSAFVAVVLAEIQYERGIQHGKQKSS